MALHVTLVRDSLKGEGALRPRVVQTDTVDMDTLLHYMATDTALEETDMRAAISRLNEALGYSFTGIAPEIDSIWVADTDRCGNGFRIVDWMAQYNRCRPCCLKAQHLGK